MVSRLASILTYNNKNAGRPTGDVPGRAAVQSFSCGCFVSINQFDVVEVHHRACGALEVVAVEAGRCYHDDIGRLDAFLAVFDRNFNLHQTFFRSGFVEYVLAVSEDVVAVLVEELSLAFVALVGHDDDRPRVAAVGHGTSVDKCGVDNASVHFSVGNLVTAVAHGAGSILHPYLHRFRTVGEGSAPAEDAIRNVDSQELTREEVACSEYAEYGF